jgi:hypothetical protein
VAVPQSTQLWLTVNGADGTSRLVEYTVLNGGNELAGVTHTVDTVSTLYTQSIANYLLGDVAVDPAAHEYALTNLEQDLPQVDYVRNYVLLGSSADQPLQFSTFHTYAGLATLGVENTIHIGIVQADGSVLVAEPQFGLQTIVLPIPYGGSSDPIPYIAAIYPPIGNYHFNGFAVDPQTGRAYLSIDFNPAANVQGLGYEQVDASERLLFNGNLGDTTLGPITSLAFAAKSQVLYFTTATADGHVGGIYAYNTIDNPAGQYVELYDEATGAASGPHGQLTHIVVDAQSNSYFVTDTGEADPTKDGIYAGSFFSTPVKIAGLSAGAQIGGMAINSAPILTLAGDPSVHEHATSPTLLLLPPVSGAQITDDNSPLSGSDTASLLDSATVRITNAQTGDELYVNALQSGTLDGGKIAFSWDESSHTLTLSGKDTIAAYTAALDAVAYADLSTGAAQRSFLWTVNDGFLDSNQQTTTAEITPDAPPTIANLGPTTAAVEQVAVAVDTALTLADVDNTTLASAKVSVTGNFHAGEDVLAFANDGSMGNIAALYDGASGILTLTSSGASATLAQWQAALHAVTYTDISDTPNAADRSISFVVNDGIDDSLSASKTVTVAAVNDAPVVNGAVSLAPIAEDSGARLITQAELLGNASDVDGPPLTAVNLAISTGSGMLVDNHNGTWSYTPALSDDTAVSFTYQVTDGIAAPVADSATLDITPVNDAPVVNGSVTLAAMAEDSGARLITRAELLGNASDVDGPALAAINLAIAAGGGTLLNNNNGTWSYTPAPNDDTAVSFAYQVTDGIAAAVADSATLDITPVNDAPVLHDVPAGAAYANGPSVILAPGLTITDVDNTTLTSATVHISAGALAAHGDVLSVSAADLAGTNILANYNAASETLTLSGADTLAHYQQVLEHVAFETSNFGTDQAQTIDWQLNDGSAANNLGDLQITDISLHRPQSSDFSGNGHGGILWQNTDGTPAAWLTDGTTLLSGANVGVNPGSNWHEIGAGDFDGDGNSDILWQNQNGTVAEWFMNGTSLISGASVAFNPGASWHVIGTGDFNGDGKADILWQNQDGTPAVWLMDGLNILQGTNVGFNPGPSWHVIGAGDFNGDGKADILWQNDSGQAAVWLMNGTSLISGANVGFNPGPSWSVQAAGDFNGDGKADILWQNHNGQAAVWLMDGTSLISGQNVGFNPGAAWQVHGAGDFNHDGKADILWQNLDGTAAVWLMDGTSLISGANVGFDPGTSWHVVPQHRDLL